MLSFEPRREDILGKAHEVYSVNKIILKSKEKVIDLPWKKEADSENVVRNVTHIQGNTGSGQSPLTTEWLGTSSYCCFLPKKGGDDSSMHGEQRAESSEGNAAAEEAVVAAV
ncbi:hypothetical protein K7X08_030723 [Anisodus acutangulus]|uniref:Uncharacterized protein n=1 Tax=Anisodus acutangulus TaxID=402998 RepID=A0A9Q1RB44_9SOLA|nr:hypothetical protein K7X08_030723 [Anisodus acutangulus]